MANSAFFTIFAPALVKDTPYGVGRPSSESSFSQTVLKYNYCSKEINFISLFG